MPDMDEKQWASIIADSLAWEEAHLSVENATRALPAALRGRRAPAIDRSVWEILEHIRIAQHDLLEFCTSSAYRDELEWPSDYWPPHPAPPDDESWHACLASIARDRADLAAFARSNAERLTERIAAGTGQTSLRTLLVALDHSSYHTAQLVAVRRLIGAWPPEDPDA